MNKFIQNLLVILLPFYPLWAWLCHFFTKKFDFVVSIFLLPIALYYIVLVNRKLPKYLLFFIIFTIYHICSVFINNTFPKDTNKIFFLLTDPNILACVFLIIVENTIFKEK